MKFTPRFDLASSFFGTFERQLFSCRVLPYRRRIKIEVIRLAEGFRQARTRTEFQLEYLVLKFRLKKYCRDNSIIFVGNFDF